MSAPALQPVSTVEALVGAVRERLLSGALAPGTALREHDLASEYGVGRHSVRAALQSLAHEGLVRHEPNRGASVPELTSADAADLARLRAAIEVEAARTTIACGGPARPVVAAVERLEALEPGAGWDAVVEADLEFHAALVDAAGSPRMARAWRALLGEIRLCLAQLRPGYGSPAELAAEHRSLLAALSSREPGRAERELRAHLESTARRLGAPA